MTDHRRQVSRRRLIQVGAGCCGVWLLSSGLRASPGQRRALAPKPYGALPSPRQRAWHELETYGFLHFTVNTFTDREWGLGDEDPAIFNPTDFSAEQIATTAKAGGLKQLILTAKHHDGFCLWPSRQTEHTIARSPYKNGHGDIVGEIAAACARHGLKFGVYVSPWDRNNAEYGRPGYVSVYHGQLRELLTQYGKLHEVWFDGANGGDGYYGGARETRKIDAETYYQWDVIRAMVRELQPDAVMFADAHMDVRWVGNEDGVAGDPCWPTMDEQPYTPERGNAGVRGGDLWNPAEVDVSIRPGWFWHADENDQVRSAARLLKLYFESAGRGGNLLLNVPPDRRGRIFEADALALKTFREVLDRALSRNLALGGQVSASSVFSPSFGAANVLSGDHPWAALENDRAGSWVAITLPDAVTFNMVRLREAIEFGVRIDEFAFEVWKGQGWETLVQHRCIGPRRLIRLETPVTTRKVRLRIIQAAASPVLAEFGLYLLDNLVAEPFVERNSQGVVTLRSEEPGLAIFYTVDGSQPDTTSPRYTLPFSQPGAGTVRALAVRTAGGERSAVISRTFDVAPKDWRVLSGGGDDPESLLRDGALLSPANTPIDLVIDLAQAYDLKGFTLKPLSSHTTAYTTAARMGPPGSFTAWVGMDGHTWGEPAGSGEFANIEVSRSPQAVHFNTPRRGRYLRLRLPHAIHDKPIIGIGEIGILTR